MNTYQVSALRAGARIESQNVKHTVMSLYCALKRVKNYKKTSGVHKIRKILNFIKSQLTFC